MKTSHKSKLASPGFQDTSGAIEQNEFIRPLSRWVRDSKTAPRRSVFLGFPTTA